MKQRGFWLLGERQELFCFGGLGALIECIQFGVYLARISY